jgi:hypothetical protein
MTEPANTAFGLLKAAALVLLAAWLVRQAMEVLRPVVPALVTAGVVFLLASGAFAVRRWRSQRW